MLCITTVVPSCLRPVGASKHTLPIGWILPASSYPSANRCKLQVTTVYYNALNVVRLQLQVQSFKAKPWNSPNAPTNMAIIHHQNFSKLRGSSIIQRQLGNSGLSSESPACKTSRKWSFWNQIALLKKINFAVTTEISSSAKLGT